MVISIKHNKQITEEEEASEEVEINRAEWNEDHVITGHDKALHDDLDIDAATLEGDDKATVQDHTPKAHTLGSHTGTAKVITTLSFAVVDTLETGADQSPTIVAPCTLTIVKVKVVVKTAPTGASLIVDVNKAGTTIFTTQGNRPEIAIGETQDDSGTPDVTALSEGDKVTIDIDQVGSTVAGADLTVEVVCQQDVALT